MPYLPGSVAEPPAAEFIDLTGIEGNELLSETLAAEAARMTTIGGEGVAEYVTAGGVADIAGEAGVDIAAGASADLVAPALVGYGVYRGLRAIPGWDDTFKGIGGHLDDALNSVIGGGGDKGASLIDVHVRINANNVLRNQVNAGRVTAAHARDIANSRRIAQHSRAIDKVSKGAAHAALNAQRNANAYTGALTTSVVSAMIHRDNLVRADAQRYANNAQANANAFAVQHIYRPLGDRITTVENELGTLRRALPALISVGATAVVASHLKPVLAHLATLTHDVTKLTTENDECTQPMCETVGPKTDWGKLFKKFAPAAIFALLAELAALHPDKVAEAAETLADGVGPVLEVWAEKWIGLLPGTPTGEGKKVADVVGTISGVAGL